MDAMTTSEFLRAAFDGDLEGVRAGLEQGLEVDLSSEKGMTALMMAAWQRDQVEVARFLLDRGADGSLRQSSSGWSALTFAAVNGGENCLRLFFDRGLSLDEEAGDWKALAFAVQYRSRSTVRMLLEAGADPNRRDEEGRTPLMRAARNSDVELVPLLLAAGADAGLADAAGDTALHFAASRARHETVEALLAAGADPHAKNRAGQTPFSLATDKKRKRSLTAMHAAG